MKTYVVKRACRLKYIDVNLSHGAYKTSETCTIEVPKELAPRWTATFRFLQTRPGTWSLSVFVGKSCPYVAGKGTNCVCLQPFRSLHTDGNVAIVDASSRKDLDAVVRRVKLGIEVVADSYILRNQAYFPELHDWYVARGKLSKKRLVWSSD